MSDQKSSSLQLPQLLGKTCPCSEEATCQGVSQASHSSPGNSDGHLGLPPAQPKYRAGQKPNTFLGIQVSVLVTQGQSTCLKKKSSVSCG